MSDRGHGHDPEYGGGRTVLNGIEHSAESPSKLFKWTPIGATYWRISYRKTGYVGTGKMVFSCPTQTYEDQLAILSFHKAFC